METIVAKQRLEMLFDENSFVETNAFTKNGEKPVGVITGYGFIDGNLVYAFSQDSQAFGGAMGKSSAIKIKKLYELALKTGAPIVGIYDSKGADISEGVDALDAYAKVLKMSNSLSGVVPQISLILGVCSGISSIIATTADICIMSENAELFLAPPFNTKANGDNTPSVGTAKFAQKAGIAHIVTDENTAILKTKELVSRIPSNNLSPVPIFEHIASEGGQNETQKCADANSVIELFNDFGDGSKISFATIGGTSVGIVETIKDNFISSDDANKIGRFVRFCDSFSIPIITFVDTKGFVQSSTSELSGGIRQIAMLSSAYAEATTPKISVIVGNCIGSAYIVFGSNETNSDITICYDNAVVSCLEPLTAVEFLWHEKLKDADDLTEKRNELSKEYISLYANPFELAKNGYAEYVVSPEQARETIISVLDLLSSKRVNKIPKKHNNSAV